MTFLKLFSFTLYHYTIFFKESIFFLFVGTKHLETENTQQPQARTTIWTEKLQFVKRGKVMASRGFQRRTQKWTIRTLKEDKGYAYIANQMARILRLHSQLGGCPNNSQCPTPCKHRIVRTTPIWISKTQKSSVYIFFFFKNAVDIIYSLKQMELKFQLGSDKKLLSFTFLYSN